MNFRAVKITFTAAKQTSLQDLLLRFIFGGIICVVVGLIGEKSALIGGLFLGFPSILPATITLIKKREGRGEAAESARGAVFGSIGLLGFATTMVFMMPRASFALSLFIALSVWLLAGVMAWRVFADER